MPNVTVPAAVTGLPSASLLTSSGHYDRAAILRAAHARSQGHPGRERCLGCQPTLALCPGPEARPAPRLDRRPRPTRLRRPRRRAGRYGRRDGAPRPGS